MTAELLRLLYGYNHWATERILDTAARLTPEQFAAPAGGEQRSVRDTLVHMLRTQKGWLSWWDGSLSPAEAYALPLNLADFPDIAAVRGMWKQVEQQTEAFVTGLSDAKADEMYVQAAPNGSE